MAKPRNVAENKAARAQAAAARKAASKERRTQLWQAFNIQRQEDKRLLPYMIGAFVLIVGASVAAAVWAGGLTMITLIPFGVVLGGLAAFIVFSRRAQKAIYKKAEGQTGAAAWVLDNLRGKWRVTPGVAATGHFDAVHRVLGRPGVILVGEGSAARVKPLLAQEKKRTARLIGDTPIYDIVVGNGEGEVPLGEGSERYRIRVLDGAAVLREVEVGAPAFVYDAAMRTIDAPSAAARIEVAQGGALYGWGAGASLDMW